MPQSQFTKWQAIKWRLRWYAKLSPWIKSEPALPYSALSLRIEDRQKRLRHHLGQLAKRLAEVVEFAYYVALIGRHLIQDYGRIVGLEMKRLVGARLSKEECISSLQMKSKTGQSPDGKP